MSPVTGEGGRWICFVVSWWPPSPPPALCPCRCSPRSCSAGPSSAWGSPWLRRGGTSRIQTSRDPRRGLPHGFRHFGRCGAHAHFQTHVFAPEIFFGNSKHFCHLVIVYHYLDVVVDRAGLAVGGGGDPAVAGLRGLQILPGAVVGVAAGQGAARTRPWTRQVLGIRNRTVGVSSHSFVIDIFEGINDIILIASNALILIALRPISALHFKLNASDFVLCFKHKSF